MGKYLVPRNDRPDLGAGASWHSMDNKIKAMHAVGRTCSNSLQTLAIGEEVESLWKSYYPDAYDPDLSITQRLDFIATEILRQWRAEHMSLNHSVRNEFLTPGMWELRSKREIPWGDMENIDSIVGHRRRSKSYTERVIDVPYDKRGNRYGVFTHPPSRVESW